MQYVTTVLHICLIRVAIHNYPFAMALMYMYHELVASCVKAQCQIMEDGTSA